MQDRYQVSCRRACALARICPNTWYYKSRARDAAALRMRIREIAQARPRFGYVRIWIMLRREGWTDNKKRIHRLYRLEGLQVRMNTAPSTVPTSCVKQKVSGDRINARSESLREVPNEILALCHGTAWADDLESAALGFARMYCRQSNARVTRRSSAQAVHLLRLLACLPTLTAICLAV